MLFLESWLQGTEAVACMLWSGELGQKKKKEKKENQKFLTWVCSHGGDFVLGAGPREQRGEDLVGRPPDLLHHPSDSSAKTHVFCPKRKPPVPAASRLQPRPARLPGAAALRGCCSPRSCLAAALDAAVFVCDPSHSRGFDFSSSDLSFPVAPRSSDGSRSRLLARAERDSDLVWPRRLYTARSE